MSCARAGSQYLRAEGKQEGRTKGREGGRKEDGLRGGSTCLYITRPEFISGLSPDDCLPFSGPSSPHLENKDGIPCLSAQMWDQISNPSLQMGWVHRRVMLRREGELPAKLLTWVPPAQVSTAKMQTAVYTNPRQHWVS